jgi:RimJ/RimL family protein N-acetyltransferase
MLKPYTSDDFKLLEKWVTDEDLLLQFAGTDFSYPITTQQMTNYESNFPERCFYVAYENETPFAFGEIILQDSGIPKLARILVGEPLLRGKGLGGKFIKSLLAESARLYNTKTVELLVWDQNIAAIKCYERAGFIYSPEIYTVLVWKDKKYNIHKMTYYF